MARAALSIDAAAGGRTTWLVFGRVELADLLRAVGIHTLNGTLPVPQLALWRRVDPEGRYLEAYNRYGFATVVPTPGRAPSFRALQPTMFSLSIDPASPALRALGATHVLLDRDDRGAFGPESGFEEVARVGTAILYRVTALPPGARPDARGAASPPATR